MQYPVASGSGAGDNKMIVWWCGESRSGFGIVFQEGEKKIVIAISFPGF